MRRCNVGIFTIAVVMLAAQSTAFAHVPYLEYRDLSESRPFVVPKTIEQSMAVYAWFRTAQDVDVYEFEVTEPVRVFVESLVPMCPGYENLLPWFAVVGPGLPPPGIELPFEVPPGYGAVVVPNLEPGETRDTFYEPFGAKWYYEGPEFDETAITPGTWYIYYWDPSGAVGDYVAVLGYIEQFERSDIIRALFYTPRIRNDEELHVDCPQ
jgi:hypothetical protein